MPTSSAFKDFVLECLESSTTQYRFSARKMFGEYCIYVRPALSNSHTTLDSHTLSHMPKPLFLLCDETLFIKQYPQLATILESAPKAPFYKGTKQEWYIIDIDSTSLLQEVVETIAPLLPEPKVRKIRKPRHKKTKQ